MLVENVRKIAVLRANGIGDFVFALPALEALRRAYPRAEIVLLGLGWHAAFLQGRPGPVDRVVVIPPLEGLAPAGEVEDPQQAARFFDAMRLERFDLALQMHGGGRYSNRLVGGLGARLTAGTRTPDAPPLDRWIPYQYFHLEVLRYLEIAALVGAGPVTLEPCLQLLPADLEEAAAVLPPDGRPLAALHAGAGGGRRRWPPEKFAAVAGGLARAGARVVVVGSERDREAVQELVGCMRTPFENLCGRLSLGGLAGLFSRCRVVVSNDSGPLHLAAAVGAATVGVYWCVNLITGGPVTTARHRALVSWRLDCPLCGANCITHNCGHEVSFVADIHVEEVLEPALELLTTDDRR